MIKNNLANRNNPTQIDGYDPIALTRATERVVVKAINESMADLLARSDSMVELPPLRRWVVILDANSVLVISL